MIEVVIYMPLYCLNRCTISVFSLPFYMDLTIYIKHHNPILLRAIITLRRNMDQKIRH